ncbi:hypothetical protein NA57DRAFT_80954 [Rhizodiscina lignyota]|uniref:Uncharacterized protein n=1 Tax=Rhizodiscina lignyota TaxID=1504668 RepID=A0A9P4I7Q6_9PEZI|nr:hypothetical protein NA57DRAFT_80954 [Rhizodiscina lignyota]
MNSTLGQQDTCRTWYNICQKWNSEYNKLQNHTDTCKDWNRACKGWKPPHRSPNTSKAMPIHHPYLNSTHRVSFRSGTSRYPRPTPRPETTAKHAHTKKPTSTPWSVQINPTGRPNSKDKIHTKTVDYAFPEAPRPHPKEDIPGSQSPAAAEGMMKVHIHHWIDEVNKQYTVRYWLYGPFNLLINPQHPMSEFSSGSLTLQNPGMDDVKISTSNNFKHEQAEINFHYDHYFTSTSDWDSSEASLELADSHGSQNYCTDAASQWTHQTRDDTWYRDFDCYFHQKCGPNPCTR